MTESPRGDQSPSVVSLLETRPAVETADRDLRTIFRMHSPYVWNTLRRMGVGPSDLEDVTQDVFLQVGKHMEDYDSSRPIKPWLFGFAFRIASQYRRRAHRRRETSAEIDTLEHPGALQDETLGAQDDRQLVLSALESVELGRRAVFVLHEIDGVGMAAIAQTLAIPVNTAYSRLRVAREEFAAAVKRLRPEGKRR